MSTQNCLDQIFSSVSYRVEVDLNEQTLESFRLLLQNKDDFRLFMDNTQKSGHFLEGLLSAGHHDLVADAMAKGMFRALTDRKQPDIAAKIMLALNPDQQMHAFQCHLSADVLTARKPEIMLAILNAMDTGKRSDVLCYPRVAENLIKKGYGLQLLEFLENRVISECRGSVLQKADVLRAFVDDGLCLQAKALRTKHGIRICTGFDGVDFLDQKPASQKGFALS